MYAAAGLPQGVTELGQHTGWGVADHAAAGIALHSPVLLVEFTMRARLAAEAIDEFADHHRPPVLLVELSQPARCDSFGDDAHDPRVPGVRARIDGQGGRRIRRG